jgi:hypothetical protein
MQRFTTEASSGTSLLKMLGDIQNEFSRGINSLPSLRSLEVPFGDDVVIWLLPSMEDGFKAYPLGIAKNRSVTAREFMYWGFTVKKIFTRCQCIILEELS